MKFLHKPVQAKIGERIVVEFDKPTKVLLVHSSQFNKYKGGRTYQYRGGFAEESPVEFKVPFAGTWHAIVEKGTYNKPLDIKGSVRVEAPKYDTLNGADQNETHTKYEEEYDDTYE